ncbi:nucleolar protein 8 [Bombina bombina]|uniref:nucleolar protein 8 n=1 Tax=Bombina bombina TaxID=8345 RepID=UPI00235A83F4|nr:nucleolar protein 8 [Bombina bombina]
MEASKRRLYVGGIGPTVTETELKERFGKFGNVDGVDLISRKDEQGNPVKTFAYLNINISEVDLKKCMSVLNKTKWKGGMLQIEMAKESFLHRLSQERQEATEKKPGAQPQRDLVQSLKDSGVTEFQMKAAVPGTEVPNHKDWVVSKYGRVLPVLHLKANNKSKVIKYDPSKYCHNIKKLEAGSCEAVPVSQLTWHLEGGDDEISKKRRGEFPSPKNPVQKKLKLEKRLDTSETGSPRKFNRKDSLSSDCVSASASGGRQVKTPSGLKAVNGHLVKRNRKSFSDGESDSEEELKAILEREKKARQEGMIPTDDANLEVVADSFELSYTTHWDCKNKSNTKKGSTKDKDDIEYDSADTDEIISVTKTVQKEKSINMEMQKGPLEKKKLKKETIVKGKFIDMEMPKGTKDDSEYDSADTDEIIAVTKTVQKDKGINMDMRKGTLEKNKPHILTKKETSQKGKVINMKMLEGTKDDSEYDSADTDEIIAVTKTVQKDKGINMDMRKGTLEKNKPLILTKKETSQKGKVINMEMLEGTKDDSEYDSADTDEIIAVTKAVQKDKPINNERQKGTLEKENPHVLPKKLKKTVEDKDSHTSIRPEHGELDSQSVEENSDSESSDSCSDEEYNSMMQNCYRLDLTMGDLEKLANSAKESSEEETNDKKSDSDQGELENSKVQTPVTKDRKRTGIDPEDIVASILQDEDDDDRSDKRSKQKRNNVPPAVFPEFKGLGSLLGKTRLEKGEVSMNTLSTPKTTKSLAQGAAKGAKSSSVVKSSSDVSKKEKEQEPGSRGVSDSKVGHKQVSSQPKANKRKEEDSSYSSDNDTSSVESSSEDEASNAPSAAALHNLQKGTKAQTDAGKKHLVEQPTPRMQQRGGDKQLQDNKKRLAAMEERRKERELQKKTIQGALLKSDAKISSKGQHIVFGSESESEHEKMEAEASDASQSSDAASKNNETVPGPNVTAKLFESSEDSDDSEENDDQGRFQIKSQYEGASGEKQKQHLIHRRKQTIS